MPEKKLSIRELAKLAGVSPATVSLAINKKAGVNAATRKRVLEIAEAHGYLSDLSIQRTASGIKNIAVVLHRYPSKVSEVFQTELNQSVIDACLKEAYNAVFTSIRNAANNPSLPGILLAQDVDGIISIGDTDEYTFGLLLSTGLPLVMLDSSTCREDAPSVYVDYQQAAYAATNYLISLGHRDIAFIGNEQQHQFNMRVFGGFQNAMQEGSLQLISVNRIQMNVFDETSCDTAMETLFDSRQEYPTALFCATDLHAIYALNYLIHRGIKVPGDVSIIGVDDLIPSKFVYPPLTTIRVNRVEIGRLGVELLLKKIAGRDTGSVILPSNELIIRGTTAAPRN